MDKNDVIEYVMTTPHNTNRAVLSSMLNQLTEGGGGGSSDFSTATVTFRLTNAGDDIAAELDLVRIDIDDDTMHKTVAIYDAEEQHQIVLYKGLSVIDPMGNTVIKSVSGDAELSYGTVYAYGDCTVVCEGVYTG